MIFEHSIMSRSVAKALQPCGEMNFFDVLLAHHHKSVGHKSIAAMQWLTLLDISVLFAQSKFCDVRIHLGAGNVAAVQQM